MKNDRLRLLASAICACVVSAYAGDSQAKFINSINFLGAHQRYDAEAEYRLLQLGIAIVEAGQVGALVSLSVKGAYGASILGNVQSNSVALNQARNHGNALRTKWAEVDKLSRDTATWLNEKLRPEYADAFCSVVGEGGDFQSSLIDAGASEEYMNWAFEIIGNECQKNSSTQSAVLSAFGILGRFARTNADNVSVFFSKLNEISENDEAFINRGMYGYIFENLAIRGEKPVLFVLDEIYFTGLTRFNIFYEALEQVSREAHTRIRGTHDQTFQTFNLQFTK